MSRLDSTTLITDGRVDGQVVETPVLVRTRRLISWAARQNGLIQIVGPSGTGKTTATIDAAAGVVTDTGIKAARISVPHRPAPRLLALTLVEQITGSRMDRPLDYLEAVLVRILRDDPYLLVIDEAQNLNTGGIERLRSLWERAAFGGMFVGDQRLTRILSGSPQLESRIDRRITFDPLHGAELYDFVRQMDPILADAADKDLNRVERRCCRSNLRKWRAWLGALNEIREAREALGHLTRLSPELMDAACSELG